MEIVLLAIHPIYVGSETVSKQFTESKWYSYMSLHLLEMQYTLSLMAEIL
jgi:TRAP-type mannitol/chloroaromatic compound transport system permease small subunit